MAQAWDPESVGNQSGKETRLGRKAFFVFLVKKDSNSNH